MAVELFDFEDVPVTVSHIVSQQYDTGSYGFYCPELAKMLVENTGAYCTIGVFEKTGYVSFEYDKPDEEEYKVDEHTAFFELVVM